MSGPIRHPDDEGSLRSFHRQTVPENGGKPGFSDSEKVRREKAPELGGDHPVSHRKALELRPGRLAKAHLREELLARGDSGIDSEKPSDDRGRSR